MSRVRKTIVELGDPVLRQVAQPVPCLPSPEVESLIERLVAIAAAANGVGIAAPQLGVPWQLLIIASRPNPRYPDAPTMEPTPLLNPRLVAHGDLQVEGWEGCLSVPGLRGRVSRYHQVEVEYLDRSGITQRRVYAGFIARIFQHEYDHLQGKVFLDHVKTSNALMTEREYHSRVVTASQQT